VVVEADDVRAPVTGHVGEQSQMLVDAPGIVVAEAGGSHARLPEAPVAVAERGPHEVITEADEVGAPIASQVGDQPRVPVGTPTLARAEVGEASGELKAAGAVA
jgi:hypothetical protein